MWMVIYLYYFELYIFCMHLLNIKQSFNYAHVAFELGTSVDICFQLMLSYKQFSL